MASKSLLTSHDSMSFGILDNIEGQFCNQEVMVRLIHFWEARNFKKGNVLMGVELLFLDSECNAVQAFISANRLFRHEDTLKRGSVYKLKKFMIRPAKTLYRVSDYKHNILFTDLTTMVAVSDGGNNIAPQKFRFKLLADLAPIADTDIDLYDVIGHLRLISGDNLKSSTTPATSTEVGENRSKDRVFLHLLMEDGETVRVSLWGNIAGCFRERWNNGPAQPTILLITTVNPKNIGGAMTLSSTAATRLFFDSDVAASEEFMTRCSREGQNSLPTVTTASSAITKYETVTIKEINTFLQGEPQKASFYCIATVDDILDSCGWHYISCTSYRCSTKLGKSETSLYCTTCKKTNNVGLIRYRFEISVRDKNNDAATFVIFDGDGKQIAGRQAGDVLNELIEAAGDDGRNQVNITAPQCIKSIIGRTCKFQIKLTDFNFGASRQTFTVSRIVSDEADMNDDVEEPQPAAEDKDNNFEAPPSLPPPASTVDMARMEKKKAHSLLDGQTEPTSEKGTKNTRLILDDTASSIEKKEGKRPRVGV